MPALSVPASLASAAEPCASCGARSYSVCNAIEAADLAALAAAELAVRGDPGTCAAAGEVAGANGARLTTCAVGGGAVVEVAVAVPVRLGPLGVSEAGARARAGPVVP